MPVHCSDRESMAQRTGLHQHTGQDLCQALAGMLGVRNQDTVEGHHQLGRLAAAPPHAAPVDVHVSRLPSGQPR